MLEMGKLQKKGKTEETKRKKKRRRVKAEESLHSSCRSPEAVVPDFCFLTSAVRNLSQVHHAGRARTHTCKTKWKVKSCTASHKRGQLAPTDVEAGWGAPRAAEPRPQPAQGPRGGGGRAGRPPGRLRLRATATPGRLGTRRGMETDAQGCAASWWDMVLRNLR